VGDAPDKSSVIPCHRRFWSRRMMPSEAQVRADILDCMAQPEMDRAAATISHARTARLRQSATAIGDR
jgi:hypothetical protein